MSPLSDKIDLSTLENELKCLLVDALKLEHLRPEEIANDETLFGDGLGLDSIDALELGAAIRKKYGVTIDTVTKEIANHFASIHNLARFIAAQQGE